MEMEKIFEHQIIETDEGLTIDLADVVKVCEQAEIVDIDAEFGEVGAETWQEHVKMKDGKHYMLKWHFPEEEIPTLTDGTRDPDDGSLPWHKQEYIVYADRYEWGEEEDEED